MKKIIKKRNHKLTSVYQWAADYKSLKPMKPKDQDFSAEDDLETQTQIEVAASNEFKRRKALEAYNYRKGKILYLRSVGRSERIRLKEKYGHN